MHGVSAYILTRKLIAGYRQHNALSSMCTLIKGFRTLIFEDRPRD